jgi:hypothetical protein
MGSMNPTKHWWCNQDESPVFGGIRVAHFGFTTSVWWGSVLLILVSPPVFGGVRVAHLGFTTTA